MYIDHNLSWNVHIKELAKKIVSGYWGFEILNPLVQLHFHYCSIAWDSYGKTMAIRLQKLKIRQLES